MRRLFFRMRADERLDSRYHLDAMRHEFLTDESEGEDEDERVTTGGDLAGEGEGGKNADTSCNDTDTAPLLRRRSK